MLDILPVIMYASMALTSFAIFLLIASFRGKSSTDWFLLLRDLLISLMAARFLVVSVTVLHTPEWLRNLHWFLMSVVSIGLFVSLVDQHVIKNLPIIRKKLIGK